DFAFPAVISLHAIGMGFFVGTNVAMDLRILGFIPGVPVSVMERFFPVMRFGFWMNAFSGVLLLIAYPTKALTNPLFYVKLSLIALGLVLTWVIRNRVLRDPHSHQEPMSTRSKF